MTDLGGRPTRVADGGDELECARPGEPLSLRVLIVERLIPDEPADAVPALLSDVNMLINTGGRERTNAEYASLLAEAGLNIGTVQPVAFPYGIIEGLSA